MANLDSRQDRREPARGCDLGRAVPHPSGSAAPVGQCRTRRAAPRAVPSGPCLARDPHRRPAGGDLALASSRSHAGTSPWVRAAATFSASTVRREPIQAAAIRIARVVKSTKISRVITAAIEASTALSAAEPTSIGTADPQQSDHDRGDKQHGPQPSPWGADMPEHHDRHRDKQHVDDEAHHQRRHPQHPLAGACRRR